MRSGVDRLVPEGVVDSEGTTHTADVIVWATGFRPNEYLAPMRVTGRDGVDLREHWGNRPRAHLGVTVPDFPNFFMLYGPGTNLASGGSIILASECEMAHVMSCLGVLAEGHGTIEPTREAYEDWYEKNQTELAQMVWSSPAIEHNYYTNDEGAVHVLNPFRIVDYWTWTREFEPSDHDIR